jgi:hypothetical protein
MILFREDGHQAASRLIGEFSAGDLLQAIAPGQQRTNATQ